MRSTTLALAALACLGGAVDIEAEAERYQHADLYVDTPNTKDLHKYEFVGTRKNFHDAEQHCRSKGGHLASVKGPNENNIISGKAGNHAVWVGGHDSGTRTWTWTDGSAFGWSNWNPGEPNNVGKGGEDCLGLWGNGKWNDFSCSRHSLAFVCEYISNETKAKGPAVRSQRFTQTHSYRHTTAARNLYHWMGTHNLPAAPWKALHSKPTVNVVIDWQDQGWGNQKGAFMIRLIRNGDPAGQDVKHHRVKRPANRKTDRFPATNVSKNFIHGDTAQLWYYVGGGGGHKLIVHSVTINVAGSQ